ncbi:hypothetical protein [Deinococcus sp. PEB2-67]
MVLHLLAALPLWYWVAAAVILLVALIEGGEETREALAIILRALYATGLFLLIGLLWPLFLAWTTVERTVHLWRRRPAQRSPQWYLDRWAAVPRGFSRLSGRWMVTGQWFPTPALALPVQFAPRHACLVPGWTVTLSLLIVEVSFTRLTSPTGAAHE